MKCKCPGCESVLFVHNAQLRKAKHPIIKCPICEKRIKIKPSAAKCGYCNSGFRYYDYKFNDSGPALVKCHQCASLNKVKIHY